MYERAITLAWLIVETSVSIDVYYTDSVVNEPRKLAMVYFDNPVALRQLENANKIILSKASARTFEGKSLAMDGKFHPRVLTLVRPSFK